ncbi:hypothetical protein ASZ90_012890 [hydrocarbon metagenome]|uniref:Uncharacterized protein n=1 Tax=hydrocarbon metagenome TaxID=938273 RepID=A0A0W8FAL6_9ZZZZ
MVVFPQPGSPVNHMTHAIVNMVYCWNDKAFDSQKSNKRLI